jgi:uncharacterized protein (DUF305 family)
VAFSGTTQARRAASWAVAGLLVLGTSACGADDPPPSAGSTASPAAPDAEASPEAGAGPRLVQGGEPGEEAVEVPADTEAAPNKWNHDDVMFMQMMIPHHGQALEMSAMVPDRSSDRRVRSLAERIAAGQGPEINVMAQWLSERELEVPSADEDHRQYDHGEHGHASMAGMLSEAELEQLADSRGTAFDRLFLESMIGHHEGALQMADDTAAGGLDIIVGEMRDGVTSSQSAEIARMRQLLDEL